MRPRSTAELIFEAPPRLSWPVERRLSGRAVAIWEASCRHGQPPPAADFERGERALFCADGSVGLVVTADGVAVASVGDRVAATFGLACGKLTDALPTLGAALSRAFAELRRNRAPVSFEASFTGSGCAALMLTRVVVLPLLDATGTLTQALAIVTWKEVLGAAASDGLYGELDRAIEVRRADCRLPASPDTAFKKLFNASRADAFDCGGLDRKPQAS